MRNFRRSTITFRWREEKNMQDACVWTVYLSTAMSRIEKEEKNM